MRVTSKNPFHRKEGYLPHHLGRWRITNKLMVMVEVALVLVSPTSPTRKFLLEETGRMGFKILSQGHQTRSHMESSFNKEYSVGVLGVFSFLLVMVILKVLCIIGLPTSPPNNMVVGSIVVIYCH